MQNRIIKVTEPVEIEEIEETLRTPFDPIKHHITKSLDCLAQKPVPDSINSIKESISAVEYMCKLITGNPSTTMGRAIDTFQSKGLVIYEDLEEGFKNLYHWTSDASGIRHALMDKATVDIDDAKYMIVTCSAIINYLKTMALKASIDLNANYRVITPT